MNIPRIILIAIAVLFAVQISYGQNVEYVGSASVFGATDVKIVGNYAYCTYANQIPVPSGFIIFDISTPSSPVYVGQLGLPEYVTGVFISGSYAYVTNDIYGLKIINVSNPAAPREVGSCDTPGWASDICVSGDYAYVADAPNGLQIINISDPTAPILASSCDTLGYTCDVYIMGDYAYVADALDHAGLKIFNISNPAAPILVGNYITPVDAYAVYILVWCPRNILTLQIEFVILGHEEEFSRFGD